MDLEWNSDWDEFIASLEIEPIQDSDFEAAMRIPTEELRAATNIEPPHPVQLPRSVHTPRPMQRNLPQHATPQAISDEGDRVDKRLEASVEGIQDVPSSSRAVPSIGTSTRGPTDDQPPGSPSFRAANLSHISPSARNRQVSGIRGVPASQQSQQANMTETRSAQTHQGSRIYTKQNPERSSAVYQLTYAPVD